MDVWDCALGFMDSQILLTAEELGVFRLLDRRPSTAAEVAQGACLPEDSAERLLGALCALGLVRKDAEGRFANEPEAAEQLVPGRPGYVGSLFGHLREELYPVWQYFGDALREGGPQWERLGGEAPTPAAMYEDPRALRRFMDGMHAITYRAAAELVEYAPELQRLGSLVDVGGASGAFVIALAERIPPLRAMVFDLPPVRPIAEDYFRRSGCGDRLAFRPGNFWEDELPAGVEACSLGFILHDWHTEGGSLLLEKAARAVVPGGLLIVGEYLWNDEKTGPPWVARSDLNMLVAARGRERSAPEYAGWFRDFGFELERIYLTSGPKAFLLARRRPAGAGDGAPGGAGGALRHA